MKEIRDRRKDMKKGYEERRERTKREKKGDR